MSVEDVSEFIYDEVLGTHPWDELNGIFTYMDGENSYGINVGKYTSPMDGMGYPLYIYTFEILLMRYFVKE